jgi:hypothetical protein
METLKQQALGAISSLPETASIDDMMYRLYVLDKISQAQQAIANDDMIDIQDLKKEIELCLIGR